MTITRESATVFDIYTEEDESVPRYSDHVDLGKRVQQLRIDFDLLIKEVEGLRSEIRDQHLDSQQLDVAAGRIERKMNRQGKALREKRAKYLKAMQPRERAAYDALDNDTIKRLIADAAFERNAIYRVAAAIADGKLDKAACNRVYVLNAMLKAASIAVEELKSDRLES